MTAGRYLNNIRDFEKGLDQFGGGSKEKSYTSASKVLPSGIIAPRSMAVVAVVLIFFSISLMVLFSPIRWGAWAGFFIALAVAVSYTDFWKPIGLPELALFFAFGIAPATIGYAFVEPLAPKALFMGVLLGALFSVATTIDQWQDVETDSQKRGLAKTINQTDLTISQFWYIGVTSVYVLQTILIALNLIPLSFLATITVLPLAYLTGVTLTRDLEKGSFMVFVNLYVFPLTALLAFLVF